MFRFSVFGWLKSRQQPSRPSQRHRRPDKGALPRQRTVLRLEALEDRTVPSTLTVTNLSDTGVSGDGSLRGEIAAANAADTIIFQPGLSGTITLTGGELLLNKNLTITGPGASSLTVSGNNASRVFDISNSATVTIAGLTIANGSVTGHDDTGTPLTSYGGGGILNEAGSTLTLNQDTLSNNKATAIFGATVDVFGGGLLNEGKTTVTSCTFSGNEATGGGGHSFFGGSVGGAIDNFGGATLTVTNSSFTTNQALGAGSGNFGIGGAIENNAGLNNAAASTATISNCTFTGNVASGSAGVFGNGGALDNEGVGANMTVSNSTFTDNQSVGVNGGSLANGLGGAIMNYYNCTLTVTSSLFDSNEALSHGSGSSGSGGAIANDGGDASTATVTATITNCTFVGNMASAIGIASSAYGGALINNGSHGLMIVNDSTLVANSAATTGGIAADGGGIAAGGGSSVTLNNTIVANSRFGHDLFLISGNDNSFTGNHDLIGDGFYLGGLSSPLQGNPLASLGDHGGPTQTMALLPGSPAINTGDPAQLGQPDQRGVVRSGGVNIGAYQASASTFALTVPATVTAGVPFDMTVTAEDTFGQVAVGYTGKVHFSSSDGQGSLPADYSFTAADGGTHTFTSGVTLKTTGAQSVTASDGTLQNTANTNVVVVGKATQLVITAQPPSMVTLGAAFGLTVTAEDANGNVDTTFTGSVALALASNPGGATLGGITTMNASNGVAAFTGLTLDKAGIGYTIQATSGNLTKETMAFTVDRATPTVTWANPADITYGTPLSSTQLNATADVSGAFAYTPAAGIVLGAGTQTLSVTFTPTDTADFNSVTQTATLTILRATPTVTWADPAAIIFGTPLSASQLDAQAGWTVGGSAVTVPGAFTYTPAAGTVLGVGSHTLSVTFTPADTADYTSASASVTLTVGQATPTVTWADPADIVYGTALGAAQLGATADVPGSFAYSVAAGTFLGAGTYTLTVTFTPDDSANYQSVTRDMTLTVDRAAPTVTWADPAAAVYGTPLSAAQLNATADVPGTFAYNVAAGTVLGAGAHTLSVTFTPADTANYEAVSASVTMTVDRATATVTVGVFEFNTATWKLRHSNSPGAPDVAPFAYGSPTSAPVWGDWDGDGTFTVGVVDVVPNPYMPGGIPLLRWQLKNTNAPGAPDLTFLYGQQGDVPVVGDWDGNGTFTVGVFEPDTAVWKLKNTNQQGAPDLVFAYGQRGDTPVVGDWDGNGTTTVGVARPDPVSGHLVWYLRNANSPGAPDIAPFAYGARGDTPVVGDWDGDRLTTVGAFDPATATWKLRNSNSPGAPDVAPFAYGAGSNRSRPVLSAYGPGATLQAAGGAGSVDPQAAPLSQQAVDGAVQAALTRLHEAGVSGAVLGRLGLARVQVADLPGADLGQAALASGTVVLDRTAAGHGWFVDPTPLQDEEFDASGQALAGGAAAGRMDLMTAVLHELGHLAGLPDISAAADPADLMGDQLGAGDRRTAALDQVFARTSF
jgi:hypothetical protein